MELEKIFNKCHLVSEGRNKISLSFRRDTAVQQFHFYRRSEAVQGDFIPKVWGSGKHVFECVFAVNDSTRKT
jgi:hypothetical protein